MDVKAINQSQRNYVLCCILRYKMCKRFVHGNMNNDNQWPKILIGRAQRRTHNRHLHSN